VTNFLSESVQSFGVIGTHVHPASDGVAKHSSNPNALRTMFFIRSMFHSL
jgi:hypothetical protein